MKHKANTPPALRATCSSSLVKIKRHVERILISLSFLKNNAPTVNETFHTQAMLVSVSKSEEYKADSV